ncbi:MAG TPA: glycosyltransferase family 4 protein [Longimicrobiaceae bacterium]|nr:glycosyltransferase family 4 protein [Longimicrobiaceae bacterium]
MRIFLSTDTVGGVWDHTVTLARELHHAGHQVLVAVLGEPRDERLAHLPVGVEVTWRRYRLEWMPDAAEDVAAAGAWLRRTAELWEADVVHLNQMAYAAEKFAAPVLLAVHSDVLSWFGETLGQAAPAEFAPYERWVRAGIAAADAVVTPTAYQSELVRRHFGRAADRVVHNGVQAPVGEPPLRAGALVVSAGRAWDPAKGGRVLDRAAGILGDVMGAAAPPVHLLGETVSPQGERFTAEHLVTHGRVERAEVDAWLGRATVYVGASLYEPFGLAPLEAALHGCALVLSDIGSFRELWKGCAVFFPAGDAEALANAILQLRHDPERCAKLAAGARTRALRRYTAKRMAAEYAALYQDVIAAHAASRVSPQKVVSVA